MMMIIIAGMLFGLAATALIWPLLPQRPRLRAAAFDGIVTSTSGGGALSWRPFAVERGGVVSQGARALVG